MGGQHGLIPAKDATGEKPLGGVFQTWVLSHSSFDPDSEPPVPGHFPSPAGGWPRRGFPSPFHSCF